MRYCFLYFALLVLFLAIASFVDASDSIEFDEAFEINNQIMVRDSLLTLTYETVTPSQK